MAHQSDRLGRDSLIDLLLLIKYGDVCNYRRFSCANDRAILPVNFVQVASRAARLWAFVRSIDNPINGGQGVGKVEILFSELAAGLNRSERSVFRYLSDALSKGFIHSYRVRRGWVKIRYCSLARIASRLGLERIGVVASFPLIDLEFSKVRCTEAQALAIQNQSWHQMKKEWNKFANETLKADKLLTCEKVARGPVLGRGKRLLYMRSRQRAFGGSQNAIANRLDVSIRTVQYRLSNQWRESRLLVPINKAQTAREICEEYPLEMKRDFYDFTPGAAAKLVLMGRRLYQVGTNLYDVPEVKVMSARYRKSRYLRMIGASPVTSATTNFLSAPGEGIRRFVNDFLEKEKTELKG